MLGVADEKIRKIADDVVGYISSLPRDTLVLIPIGSIEVISDGFFELPSGFCLFRTPDSREQKEKLPSFLHDLVRLSGEPPMKQFIPDFSSAPIAPGVYLGRQTAGIPTFLAGRETFNRVLDDLKVWIGIGRWVTHFSETEFRGLLETFGTHSISYGHAVDTLTGELWSRRLSVEESSYFGRLRLTIKDGDVEGYRRAFVNVVEPFFNDTNLSPAAAAYQWLVDSLTASNETNAFLACCYGLEAVLGEERKAESLTVLLAERYAYLLGETNSDRVNLRKEFKQIYSMRSRLVHGRDRRIPGIVGYDLVKARMMLDQVASSEWAKVQKKKAKDEVWAKVKGPGA